MSDKPTPQALRMVAQSHRDRARGIKPWWHGRGKPLDKLRYQRLAAQFEQSADWLEKRGDQAEIPPSLGERTR